MTRLFSNEEINQLADKYNPYDSLRDGQRKAILDIVNAYQDEKKLVELPAPTASGKTLILMIVAKILAYDFGIDLTLMTTPLVALADQFSHNPKYADVPCLIGKANYPCALNPGLTADDCMSGKNTKIPVCKECEYKKAKEVFDNSSLGYTTFPRLQYDKNIKGRVNALFIDESSSIESALRQLAEIELSIECDRNNINEWLNKRYDILTELVDELEGKIEGIFESAFIGGFFDIKKVDFNRVKILKIQLRAAMKEKHAVYKALGYIENNIPYVITLDEVEKWNKEKKYMEKVKVKHFKLITAKEPFKELVHNLAFVVLASGTPTTEMLTDEPYTIVNVEHPIPKEIRPAYFLKCGSMSYKTRDETAKEMAKIIAALFEGEEHNVIVHCGNSYPVAQLLYNETIKYIDPKLIILQTKKTRKECLNRFLNADHILYFSVKMDEGVDLKGGKFKVNIVAKLPTAAWLDQYTEARNAYDKARKGFNQWYDTMSATSMMQMYGRISRTPTDEGITYFLDNACLSFWKRYNSMGKHKIKLFYCWFDEACKVI